MFYSDFCQDRRKNTARHKAAATYEIAWDEEREAFEVYRNGQKTNASSGDERDAIDLAIGQARRDQQAGIQALVFSTRDGTRIVEWPKVRSPAA